MEKIAQLKYKVLWISFSLYFFTGAYKAYSQSPGDKFVNKNTEYVHFLNDTLIDFMLYGGGKKSLPTMYHGTGRYKITNNQLTVYFGDNDIDSLNNIDSLMESNSYWYFNERISGVDKYKIVISSSDSINLIGPIRDDYQKLNKRKFMQQFLHWPWRWSFRKEHWYDPRERELYKSK